MRGEVWREQGGGRGRGTGQGKGIGRGSGRPGGGLGHAQRRRQPNLSNKSHTTLVDHVNHRLTLREAGLRVQPNLRSYTVASIVDISSGAQVRNLGYCMYYVHSFGIYSCVILQ